MKGTKLYSIITGKCPVCHTGEAYNNKNPYQVTQIFDMHERCPHCNTKFKIEPSFFYGAMYVSYAVGIAVATVTAVIAYGVFNTGRFATFMSIVVSLVILLPIIARISRNIWMNMFFKFDKSKV